jgi:hypothetical protein
MTQPSIDKLQFAPSPSHLHLPSADHVFNTDRARGTPACSDHILYAMSVDAARRLLRPGTAVYIRSANW